MSLSDKVYTCTYKIHKLQLSAVWKRTILNTDVTRDQRRHEHHAMTTVYAVADPGFDLRGKRRGRSTDCQRRVGAKSLKMLKVEVKVIFGVF